jgi:2-oxoglutarate ferredoxin oxidoreductase subunit alpha
MRKTIGIAGAAGEGINTVQSFLEKNLKRQGYALISYKNYMSRVRGGFNYALITLSDDTVFAVEDKVDLLVALNSDAVKEAGTLLKQDGILLGLDVFKEVCAFSGRVIWVSEKQLKEISKIKMGIGMYAVGWILKYFGLSKGQLQGVTHATWDASVQKENAQLLEFGYDAADVVYDYKRTEDRILVSGNQATALGALAAGLGFYAAYPMAPSTGIMNYLSSQEKTLGIVVEQVEDEIAAAMAAIGASTCGVRAMTGTSGGGFSLMVEALGFAAVAEVPLVMCNVQRPGPATGLPTRTEQADLSFVVNASQGEFARAVMAPIDVEDAFETSFRAFNVADQYQIPVILLTDQLLADTVKGIERFDTSTLEVNRYLDTKDTEVYERYDFNQIEGGRRIPGLTQSLIMTDSHIHTSHGRVSETSEDTVALKHKFIKKMEALRRQAKPPLFYGDNAYETLFVCWGSTYGALREAVDLLNAKGHRTALLAFTDVYPLNEACMKPFIKADIKVINVEGNAFNQFGKLLRLETGVAYDGTINRYDGRPFTGQWIVEAYEEGSF